MEGRAMLRLSILDHSGGNHIREHPEVVLSYEANGTAFQDTSSGRDVINSEPQPKSQSHVYAL